MVSPATMNLRQIDQIPRHLDFGALLSWPKSLPHISWNDFLLTPNEQGSLSVDQGHIPLDQLFLDLYPKLTLPELARLYRCWIRNLDYKDPQWQKFWPNISKSYNFRDCESHREVLVLLLETPQEFQCWMSDKKVTVKDVIILRDLDNLETIKPTLECIAKTNCTKSQGQQVIEWISELILGQKEIREVTSANENESAEKWMNRIRSIRFPKTMARDLNVGEKLKGLPWPKYADVSWSRRGDESGMDVKLHVKDFSDLDNKLRGLSETSKRIQEENESPWT